MSIAEFEQVMGIVVSINELDEIITQKDFIVIRETFTCYCYGQSIKAKYYLIQHQITHRNILAELMKQRFKKRCNHIFYEGLNKINDHFYEICWGS